MVRNGFLRFIRTKGESYDLMSGLYGPARIRGPMRQRRFYSREELVDFLTRKVGLTCDVQKDLLDQLDSKRTSSLSEVWISDEQRSVLGL